MFSRKNKLLLLKVLSLFSVVRGYNILLIALAQYLASIYILAPRLPLVEVVFDLNLFVLVLVSAMVIASGYIINNFYDAEKDLINKPRKSMLDRLVILSREMIKDLENISGDLAQNYRTIPIIYGVKISKLLIGVLVVFTLIPSLLLIFKFDIGYMHYFFASCVALLLLFLLLLPKAATKKHYIWLHNILKLIIVTGVFSILLIDVDLV